MSNISTANKKIYYPNIEERIAQFALYEWNVHTIYFDSWYKRPNATIERIKNILLKHNNVLNQKLFQRIIIERQLSVAINTEQ